MTFDQSSAEEKILLEYVIRFSVEKGRQIEFMDWINANDERLREHSRPGWTYLGTWVTVGGFGAYTGETRWSLEGYESLGSDWGDEVAQQLGGEFMGMIDTVHREANLLRSATTASSMPGL